jgi:sulfur carrier protein ThiS
MPIVRLRPPLRELAEGRREVTVEGGTVVDVLRELERSHPKLGGWILDDRGKVRQHVAVFLEGERVDGDMRVATEDRLEVIGAVSGGAATELLVGTRKGLFVLRGEREGEMDVVARAFPGSSVEFAIRDPRTGRYFASVTHGQFGPRVYLADDPTGAWDQAEGPRFPEDTDTTLVRTWVITPGEVVMEIVPESDELQIEARLPPQEVDHVRNGQRAYIRFSAFNQRTTPQLEGLVSYVSADLNHDRQKNPNAATYYTVRVTLPPSERRRLGGLELVSGMPVEVFLQTGSRTMMSYLLKPITDQLLRTFN